MDNYFDDRILTVPQMIFCEQESEQLGVTLAKLMDNAGGQLGRHILDFCRQKMTKEVTILVGKGNNGGDGLVAANFLFESGVTPTVILCCGKPNTDLSKAAFEKLHKDIPVYEYKPSDEVETLIEGSDILVDCIFGTGFKGEIRENMYPLFNSIYKAIGFIIACDIPSGANAQSGQTSKFTVKADVTITFHARKVGMVLSPAKYFCGKVCVCDIGIPDEIYEAENPQLADFIQEETDKGYMQYLLPPRRPWGHKGTFGKVLSVCGSQSYIGAAGLSTLAALRTGVGLVELFTPKTVVQSLSSQILECTYSVAGSDSEGFITFDNAEKILKKAKSADCLLIGCGLGHTDETEKLVAYLVENSEIPLIIDADGINSLCPNIDVLLKKKSTVILTPHPGELARLCGVSVKEVLNDRLGYASETAKKYDVTVVSKGAETLICSGFVTKVIFCGNTALAKGGSGDMLAGIIASLTAQRPKETLCNAMLGCYILGNTAQMLCRDRSQRGIIATDILNAIPIFLKELEEYSPDED